MITDYRRGGFITLPFVTLGIIIAILCNAPLAAILSIALFGYGAALVLIILGKRPKKM